ESCRSQRIAGRRADGKGFWRTSDRHSGCFSGNAWLDVAVRRIRALGNAPHATDRSGVVKALRVLVVLVLGSVGCLTGRSAYLHAKEELAGALIRRAWQQSVQQGGVNAPWPWVDSHPVARLRIPRLQYDEIVLDSATPRSLAFGPARLLSSANFGE